MELKFAERLRKYRRDRDMTQEELAQKIGISPQSVSKWERDEGLPDVTMLPKLAGYFGVTIDALLGYDETAQKEDFDTYFQESRKIYDTQEKFDYIRGYAEKYPQDYRYARDLVHAITELPREKWDEYMPLMRENCEKIVNGCSRTLPVRRLSRGLRSKNSPQQSVDRRNSAEIAPVSALLLVFCPILCYDAVRNIQRRLPYEHSWGKH